MHRLHQYFKLSVAIVAFSLIAGVARSDDIVASPVIVVGDNWCPFSCNSGRGPNGLDGMLVELARASLAESGSKINYMILPWQRAIRGTLDGSYDIILGVSAEGRKGSMLFSDAWIEDTTSLMVGASFAGIIEKPEDLTNHRIGSIAEYLYDAGGPWDAAILDHPDRIVLYSDQGDSYLVDLLIRNRIDVAIINRDVGQYYLARQGNSKGYRFIDPGIAGKLMLGFTDSEKGRAIKIAFDAGLKSLCQKNQVAPLLEPYDPDLRHLATLCADA